MIVPYLPAAVVLALAAWHRLRTRTTRSALALLAIGLALLAVWYPIARVLPTEGARKSYYHLWGSIAATVAFLAAIGSDLHARARAGGASHRLALRLSAVLFGTGLAILVGEAVCRLTIVRSDANGYTFANAIWYSRHWRTNALGYRDIEHAPVTDGRKVVFVVGDSFVAGSGIDDPEDRFSNILRRRFRDRAVVYNLGRSGNNLRESLFGLLSHPIEPDVVIFSYYLNDIWGYQKGPRPAFILPPDGILKEILESSSLANHVYWNLYRFQKAGVGDEAWQYTLDLFTRHPTAWDDHKRDIARLGEWCSRRGIPLIAVVFPDLTRVGQSRNITAEVARAFSEAGAHAVNLTPHLESWTFEDLVVSRYDTHPSVKLNRLVARILERKLDALATLRN